MTALKSEDILAALQHNREKLRTLGVHKIGLFGSAARNTHTRDSDLDFVVEIEKKSFDTYMDLKFFLESLFGCKVDLVLPNTIKPRLKKHILDEAIYAPGL